MVALVAVGAALAMVTFSLGALDVSAHPLHTTLVQLTYAEGSRQLEGSIRVFAGDFAAAVAQRNGAAMPTDDRVSDAAALAYVTKTFTLTDASGRVVPLAWCGSRRAGDVLWLCVRASNVPALHALRLSDQMLCELFDDQINIVQATAGGRRASMLFTKGDGLKSAM
jgi:hypothetical protein